MSNVYNHRQMVPSAPLSSRVADLLEALRTEYDSLTQESSAMKIYKDDYEQRINSQIAEMAMFQTGLADLEQRHLAMRKQYEDEINRLRREIQALGGAPVVSTPFISQPQQQPMLAQGQAMPISQAHNAGMPPGSQPHASQGPGGMYGMPAASGPHNGPNGPIMTPGQPPMGGESHPGAPYAMGPGGPYGPGGNVPMGAHGQQPPQQPPTPQQQAAGVAKDRKPNVMAQQQQQQQQAQQAQQQQMANRQTPTQSVRNVGPSGQKPPQQPPTPQQQQQAQQQQPPPQQMQPQQGMVGTSQLADMDPDSVPPQLKREGSDWFVIYNPKMPRMMNIENMFTLEHNSVVCCVKFSNDGKLLATGCNRTTQIWNMSTGAKEAVLADENAPKNGDLYIRAVCFSPDGKYLVTGAEDKQIRIWDITTKKIRHILAGHEQDIYSLDFSPDGRTILSGSGDRTVRLWDLETGKNVHTFTIDDMGPKDAGVTSVAFSPNGQLVAAASLDKMIRLWDASSGQFLERIDGHKDSVYAVAFSPDGRSLLSGSLDKTLRIWDLARLDSHGRPTGPSGCRSTLTGHKDFVLSVAYSPDGNWIVSGSKDRGVQFWDPRTSQTQCMLQGHKNSVISVALSPTQHVFATGSGDFRARVWSYDNATGAM